MSSLPFHDRRQGHYLVAGPAQAIESQIPRRIPLTQKFRSHAMDQLPCGDRERKFIGLGKQIPLERRSRDPDSASSRRVAGCHQD